MEKNVHNLLGVSMDKIKEMVDVNTVVGDPIDVAGITIIPVSRVTYGFAAGGSDIPNKANNAVFGGGSGASVNVTPVAFLVVQNGNLRMLPVNANPDMLDRAISMVPDMVDKVVGVFKKEEAPATDASESQVFVEE